MARSVATTITALFAVLLAAIVALATPTTLGAAFVVGAASLALALVATIVSVRRLFARRAGDAGVWLEGATVPVAALWSLVAFAQTLSAAWWSWRVAVGVELVVAASWAAVAIVTGAAAGAAATTEREQAEAGEQHARLVAAAKAVLAAGVPTRVRVTRLAERVIASAPGELGDPVATEEMETELDRIREALRRGDEAGVDAAVQRLER